MRSLDYSLYSTPVMWYNFFFSKFFLRWIFVAVCELFIVWLLLLQSMVSVHTGFSGCSTQDLYMYIYVYIYMCVYKTFKHVAQFTSVTQSSPTPGNSMDCSMPGFLVHHQLPVVMASPTNSCPLSWWCHPTISSSAVPFSSCLQSFPASGSFQMSQFITSGGHRIGVSASASVLPINIQDWFPLWLIWSPCIAGRRFNLWAIREAQVILKLSLKTKMKVEK